MPPDYTTSSKRMGGGGEEVHQEHSAQAVIEHDLPKIQICETVIYYTP